MKRQPALKSHVIYHVYNRGAFQQKIFLHDLDYKFFMYKLSVYIKKYSIKISCFCIMPNHFHLLIYTEDKPKSISLLMKFLQYSYACKYNKRYKHTGHVFEGSYRIKSINANDLPKIIEYILMNPVRKKLVMRPEDWPYKG